MTTMMTIAPDASGQEQELKRIGGIKWLNVEECAKRLGSSTEHIRRLLRAQKLVGKRFAKAWHVDEEELQRFISTPDKPKRRIVGDPKEVAELARVLDVDIDDATSIDASKAEARQLIATLNARLIDEAKMVEEMRELVKRVEAAPAPRRH